VFLYKKYLALCGNAAHDGSMNKNVFEIEISPAKGVECESLVATEGDAAEAIRIAKERFPDRKVFGVKYRGVLLNS
jgi:hypothetical protein